MNNNTIRIIQSHVNDILNYYPRVLEINFNNKDHILVVKFQYDLYKKWNQFLKSEYEFAIISANLDKEVQTYDIKRLLLAKRFLREYYKQ